MASLVSDVNGHAGTASPPAEMLKADKALEGGLGADGAKGAEADGAIDGVPADGPRDPPVGRGGGPQA